MSGDKINGRTPEEIKMGLECCTSDKMDSCDECPYQGRPCNDIENLKDALAYIQWLEYELSEIREYYDCSDAANTELHSALYAMKRERDAAVEQLKQVDANSYFECAHCKHEELCDSPVWPCNDCDSAECPCHTCTDGSNWQWRGAEVE